MHLKKILCAVDFSGGSREALHFATELARKAQATLDLVHVTSEPARAEPELATWRAEARKRGAAEVGTVLRSGVPWEQIVAMAREDRAVDVVVLGTHGETGARRDLIGSVAEGVLRHAPCAVMVVRKREDAAAPATAG